MSAWKVFYTPEARKDVLSFDKSQRNQILKAIDRVSKNPLPDTEGGYGKPLGNRKSINLAGCLKIKLRRLGIRIVYHLERTEKGMEIIVVGIRADDEVYRIAAERLKKRLG
ncbi:MAG: type II toxin-antitoxin system RelE/ParE family toxin [Schwartzia sp.]|nr:type II toxin-antitoxin system RelE/ParE family toxin [Schwartzia sp. (in: firmicutes)]